MSNDELYDQKLRSPPQITLIDERGASYSFVELGYPSQQINWVPAPNERFDAKTSFDRLVQVGSLPAKDAVQFQLHKRNGTVSYFQRCDLLQTFPQDRMNPDAHAVVIKYFRMTHVITAQGNRVDYDYGTQNVSLIPAEIRDPDRPDCKLIISQNQGRIVAVTGPSGETMNYVYDETLLHGVSQQSADSKSPGYVKANAGGMNYAMLTSVRRVDVAMAPPMTVQEVKYDYSYAFEKDPTPDDTQITPQSYGHLELASITDELSNTYKFTYSLNQSTQYQVYTGAYNLTRKQTGIPRLLSSVSRPDNSLVIYNGLRNVVLKQDKTITGGIETVVSGPCGTYTYTFGGAHAYQPSQLDQRLGEGVVFLSFTQMDVQSAAGTEHYVFNPAAGMALSSVQDLSGNITTFQYLDPINVNTGAGGAGVAALNILFYDDPTEETSAIHNKPRDPHGLVPDFGGNHVGTKTYTYDPVFRSLTSVVDERGIKKLNIIDPVTGLTVEEKIIDTNNSTSEADDKVLRRTLNSYVHPTDPDNPVYSRFKAFLYRQTIDTSGFVLPSGYSPPAGSPAGPALQMVTDYVPDANGRVKQEIRYAEADFQQPLVTTTTYTSGGQKQTVTDPLNHTTTFEYHPQTLRLEATHFADDTSKFIVYDAHGNVTEEVDETDRRIIHQYDAFNRRTKTTLDANGNGVADPRYTAVILPVFLNQTTPPNYNGDIVTETSYNAFDLPVDITDPRGVVTHHDYDAIGRLVRTTVNASDPDPQKIQVTRFTNENGDINDDFVGGSIFNTGGFKPLRVKDPRGFVTHFEYDELYRLRSTTLLDTSYVQAMQVVNHSLYDDGGNVIYQVDALNRITRTVYDGLSQVVEVYYPTDQNTPPTSVKSFYTPSGQVWRTLDEEHAETLSFFDYAGRKTHVYSPAVLDHATQQMKRPLVLTEYDNAGNVTRIYNPLGRFTETQYDQRNRPTHIWSPDVASYLELGSPSVSGRPVTETQYDAAGRVKLVIDPMGAENATLYDLAGRVYRTIAPTTGNGQLHVTTHKLDPAGNIIEVVDAKNLTTLNVYDGLGRLESTTDANQITNTFDYDLAGNRIYVSDGLSQESLFWYDAQNRLITQVFGNQEHISFAYNALQKTSQTDSLDRVTSYSYDARNRLLSTVSPDLNRVQTYYPTGRLNTVTESTNPNASVTLSYNAAGWLVSETSSGLQHDYGYDLAGNRVHAAYGTGRTVSSTYDQHDRPWTITEGGRTTTYAYDKAGRAVSQQMGNGNYCWNDYDQLGRLKRRTLYTDTTAGTVHAELEWDYDPLGNVLWSQERWPGSSLRTAGWRLTSMTYDDSNRLETETVSHSGLEMIRTTYTYDAAHNRASKEVAGDGENGFWTYHYNEGNQLHLWRKYDEEGGIIQKSAVLTYENGNRVERSLTEGLNTQTTEYLWDAQNRLTRVELPDSSVWSYAYDYRMRRIRTHVNGAPTGAKTTLLSFSGGSSLGEWDSSVGEPSLVTTPTVEYTRGPDMGGGVGGLLYSVRGTAAKFNLSNGRGDIIAQSDSSGSLTWTASYEAYGKRTTETGTNEDKQRANSKDEDPTGLLNEGFRYRDIETGVWLSRDPAGFVDGPNLYAYVMQNPWSKFDPDGQFWSAIVTIGFAAYDSYQYASGNISGADYAGRMALNGSALLADAATGGMGGGLALRTAAIAARAGKAGQAVVKAAIAVDRADTIKSTAEAAISAKDAIQDGNYGRAALSALQVVAAKSDVLPGSKSAKEVKAETTKNVEAIVEGRLVAGSSNGFDRGQKEMAEKLGIRTVPTSGGKHAEENLLKGQVEAIGTTRTPCGPDRHDCAGQLATAGVQHSSQLDKLAKKINDAGISEPSRNRRTFAVGREPKQPE